MKVHNSHPLYMYVCLQDNGELYITENIWLAKKTKLNWILQEAYQSISLGTLPNIQSSKLVYNEYQAKHTYRIK